MIFAVIILFIGAFALNELSRIYAARNLSYKREVSKKVVEIGEEFEINTIVENDKLLPVTFLQIKEKMSNAIEYKIKNNITTDRDYVYHTAFMMAMPYQRVKRIYKVYVSKRGRYYLHEVELMAGDLLGIKLFREEMPMYQEIVALPERYDLKDLVSAFGDYYGDISVRRWIIDDPVLIVGIREYSGFEPQKNIHWPSSLRSGKLMVKKFDYTSENKAMVILNIEAFKPFWMNIMADVIEKCISTARTVIEDFEEQGIPYGLVTNAAIGGLNGDLQTQLAGWGPQHLFNITEILGRIDYGISDTFEDTLDKLANTRGNFTTYVIITPAVFEPYVEYINILSKTCERLVVISFSPDNLDLLDKDILTFVERRDDN